MTIEHNSREKFYRRPFGAVTCGTEIRFRISASGVGIPNAVRLVYKKDGGEEIREDMVYLFDVADHCIYSVKVTMPDEVCLVWYYFEIETSQGTVYYGNNQSNLGGRGEMSLQKPGRAFQITVYGTDYKTPDWFKEGIAYQIFVDRFYNGNDDGNFLGDRTDIIKREWGEIPFYKAEQFGGEYKANDFFGGNLEGVIKKLPYLKELGITVIYLNPIFSAYSNHKYDTGSYEKIDSMFGDEDKFKELCTEAEKLGIRIILDGVFNHTGSDSQYFNKNGTYDSVGAYQSQDSPYYSWYRFMDWPGVYESWWGMTTLPQVEESDKNYREYILSGKNAIIKKWLKAGASGWRLDVVDELPGAFVKELRKNAKEAKQDAVIIGEVWEDASNKTAYGERCEYFLGKELDSVMNYPMRTALIDAVLGKIEAPEFDARLMSLKENYPPQAYYSLLNMVSSHDVERVLTMMGGVPSRHEVDRDYQANFKLDGYGLEVARDRATLILGLQMTLPGVPCIYYGDEIGMQGYGDPFCRQCYPWGKEDELDPTGTMRERYSNMIILRNLSKAFSIGEFESVYKIGHVYAFIRYYDDDKYIVVANMDVKNANIRLDIARFGITKMTCVSAEEEVMDAADGIYFIDMPQLWIKVYRAE
ncbi:MAG: glycoside hydrolase family 13 protein [Oscillospiraceae bacterium]|nr:glycoside hydrolase family 13 protein [Oscillospiraceae bacterium]